MKKWNIGTRIALAVALALVATALLVPAGSALEGHMMVWLYTPEAEIRTLAGDCPAGYRCLQLCLVDQQGNTQLTNDFGCFVTH